MRVLLADDEPVALERLELALATVPEASLAGTAKNGRESLTLIHELKPDVAVLDIQMPIKDGFAVIDGLQASEFVPEVIFVTAFHDHAIRAFEVHAVDYLLKPVAFERFREALRRAQARLDARASDDRLAELTRLVEALRADATGTATGHTREVWVPGRDGLAKISTSAIDRVEAEGDYVRIHVGEGSHLLKETISALQARLDPAAFARVHRSSIVNLTRVRGMRRRGSRGMVLILNGGAVVAVGPSFAGDIMDRLNAHRWRSP